MEETKKEDRLKQIKKLDNFLESSNSIINDLLLKFNFTKEDVFEEQNNYKTCPIDKSHKVSLKHYDKHADRCTTNKKRPERDEETELPTGDLYDGRIPSVKIDKNLQYEIIKNALDKNPVMKTGVPIEKLQERELPRYHSDIQVDFSREEKLALYEYAVEKTGHHPEPEIKIQFNEAETGKKSMTFAEIVAYKRDIKRRRMKYRTTKEPPLSRTEEVRRLIDTQMEALIQYLKPEEKEVDLVPSCSKTSQMNKIVSPEKSYSGSGSSKRTFDYNRSDSREKKSEYSSHRHHSRSQNDTPSCSKSSQRKKSASPAKNTNNRSESRSHRKKNKRSRSRSRSQERDRSSKREHKKSKHKKRDRSRSRSRDRNCDYKKRKNK